MSIPSKDAELLHPDVPQASTKHPGMNNFWLLLALYRLG